MYGVRNTWEASTLQGVRYVFDSVVCWGSWSRLHPATTRTASGDEFIIEALNLERAILAPWRSVCGTRNVVEILLQLPLSLTSLENHSSSRYISLHVYDKVVLARNQVLDIFSPRLSSFLLLVAQIFNLNGTQQSPNSLILFEMRSIFSLLDRSSKLTMNLQPIDVLFLMIHVLVQLQLALILFRGRLRVQTQTLFAVNDSTEWQSQNKTTQIFYHLKRSFHSNKLLEKATRCNRRLPQLKNQVFPSPEDLGLTQEVDV